MLCVIFRPFPMKDTKMQIFRTRCFVRISCPRIHIHRTTESQITRERRYEPRNMRHMSMPHTIKHNSPSSIKIPFLSAYSIRSHACIYVCISTCVVWYRVHEFMINLFAACRAVRSIHVGRCRVRYLLSGAHACTTRGSLCVALSGYNNTLLCMCTIVDENCRILPETRISNWPNRMAWICDNRARIFISVCVRSHAFKALDVDVSDYSLEGVTCPDKMYVIGKLCFQCRSGSACRTLEYNFSAVLSRFKQK